MANPKLSLRINNELHAIRRLIENETGDKISFAKLNLSDPETLGIFSSGETQGIPYFEFPNIFRYMLKLKPDRFDDLVALNALFRPGPLSSLDEFIDRKHGRIEIAYIHPILEPILEPIRRSPVSAYHVIGELRDFIP